MKKIKFILLLLIASITSKAQFIKADLIASGLTCSMCSFATQKQLKTLSFIDSIGTDLNHTTFVLFFKKDAEIDFNLIKKKVEDAGFSVASLIITVHFDNVKLENNVSFNYKNILFYFVNTKQQVLNGDTKIKILDKGFVNDKEYKKYLKTLGESTFAGTKKDPNKQEYHLTVL
jgi:copper chaperone CopZ